LRARRLYWRRLIILGTRSRGSRAGLVDVGAGGRYYAAEGKWNLFGVADFAIVAEDRNAPNVLRLPFRLRLLLGAHAVSSRI